MPNPFRGNDEAAAYVASVGTYRAEAGLVERMYDEGVFRRAEAQRAAAAAMYPTRPPVRRTTEQMTAYLRDAVEGEQQRRLQHRAQIQDEMDRHPREAFMKQSLTPAEQKDQVKRVYDDVLKKQSKRREAAAASSTFRPQPHAAAGAVDALERNFRPAVHSPPRHDGKVLLVHGTAPAWPSAMARKKKHNNDDEDDKKASNRRSAKEMERYWSRMSQPRVVAPPEH